MQQNDDILFLIEHIKRSLEYLVDRMNEPNYIYDFNPGFCDVLNSINVDIKIIRHKFDEIMTTKPTKYLSNS